MKWDSWTRRRVTDRDDSRPGFLDSRAQILQDLFQCSVEIDGGPPPIEADPMSVYASRSEIRARMRFVPETILAT